MGKYKLDLQLFAAPEKTADVKSRYSFEEF